MTAASYNRKQAAQNRQTAKKLTVALSAINEVVSLFDNYRSARPNKVKEARDMIAGKCFAMQQKIAGK